VVKQVLFPHSWEEKLEWRCVMLYSLTGRWGRGKWYVCCQGWSRSWGGGKQLLIE
jgi:hypothetical protein